MNAPLSLAEVQAISGSAAEAEVLHLGSLPIGTCVAVTTYSSEYWLQIYEPVAGLVVCQSTSGKWGAAPCVATYLGLAERSGCDPVPTSWLRARLCMTFRTPQGQVTSSNIKTIRRVRSFPTQGEFLMAIQAYEAEQEALRLRIILNPLSDTARQEARCAIAEFPKAGRAMLMGFFLAATRERKMRAALAAFHAQSQRYWNYHSSADLDRPLTRLDWERLRNLFHSLDLEVPEVAA